MIREDFYTGEPVNYGSPPFSDCSENEAVQNASFGRYNYDPTVRAAMMQQQVYPGFVGYNTNPNAQPYYAPTGLGANPNPAFYQNNFSNPYMNSFMSQPAETIYHVEGVNFGGSEYLPSIGTEEKIEQLKRIYWEKEQEQQVSIANSYGSYGSLNYYGMPYYNPYSFNNITNELSKEIDKIKNEARDNRMALNIQLSTLAHNICADAYQESDINQIYSGKDINVPAANKMTYGDIYNMNRLQNMVPVDNSQIYVDHNTEVSRKFNTIIPKDSNLEDTFKNMGVMMAEWEMEEEMHRRKDGGNLYDSNSYKTFVKMKAAEKLGKPASAQNQMNQSYTTESMFPTLSQHAKLCDDGTLNISFGNLFNDLSINNQEQEYEKDRQRFNSFLNSIPGALYTPSEGGD